MISEHTARLLTFLSGSQQEGSLAYVMGSTIDGVGDFEVCLRPSLTDQETSEATRDGFKIKPNPKNVVYAGRKGSKTWVPVHDSCPEEWFVYGLQDICDYVHMQENWFIYGLYGSWCTSFCPKRLSAHMGKLTLGSVLAIWMRSLNTSCTFQVNIIWVMAAMHAAMFHYGVTAGDDWMQKVEGSKMQGIRDQVIGMVCEVLTRMHAWDSMMYNVVGDDTSISNLLPDPDPLRWMYEPPRGLHSHIKRGYMEIVSSRTGVYQDMAGLALWVASQGMLLRKTTHLTYADGFRTKTESHALIIREIAVEANSESRPIRGIQERYDHITLAVLHVIWYVGRKLHTLRTRTADETGSITAHIPLVDGVGAVYRFATDAPGRLTTQTARSASGWIGTFYATRILANIGKLVYPKADRRSAYCIPNVSFLSWIMNPVIQAWDSPGVNVRLTN